MQIRSYSKQRSEPEPVRLPPDFPLTVSRHSFSDRTLKKLHIHNVFEIGLCLEGIGLFVIEEKVIPFKKKDLFFINHLEMHRACSPTGLQCDWVFIMLDPAVLIGPRVSDKTLAQTGRLAGSIFRNRIGSDETVWYLDLVQEILKEFKQKQTFFRDRIVTLLTEIMVALHRRCYLNKPMPEFPDRDFKTMHRFKPAMDIISEKYSEDLSIAILAKSCFMSEGHFRRRFSRLFGKSPMVYLVDLRMGMICEKLRHSDNTITEIAMSCGFSTLSCFNRQFQKKMGCSPREWRKREIKTQ